MSYLVNLNETSIKKILMIDNTLNCPVRATAGSAAYVDMDNCTCRAPLGADLTYSLVKTRGTVNNTHTCEKQFLPGNAECTLDPRGGGSCSEGLCREHCCTAAVAAAQASGNTCPACGNTGDCYRPLALVPGWEAAAGLTNGTGWIGRINQGELQPIRGPQVNFTSTNVINAKGPPSAAPRFEYRLRWSAAGTRVVVGANPPSGLATAGDRRAGDAGPFVDPRFITLDEDTGDIYAVPKDTGNYTAWLILVDASGTASSVGLAPELDQVVLKRWDLEVTEARRLSVLPSWNPRRNTTNMLPRYEIGQVYEVPPPQIAAAGLFVDVAGEDPDTVRYVFTVAGAGEAAGSAGGPGGPGQAAAIGKFFVAQTGECSMKLSKPGWYTAKLEALDRSGATATVREWDFEARVADALVDAYGPNGRKCANGSPDDATPTDRAFTCNCDGTRFTGPNCEVASDPAQDDTTAAVIGAVLAVLILAAIGVFLLARYQRYMRSMMATDFIDQLEAMTLRGELGEAQALKGGVPRELKRGWLALIDKLGHGQFGDVWKGLLTDGENHAPEYVIEIIVTLRPVTTCGTCGNV